MGWQRASLAAAAAVAVAGLATGSRSAAAQYTPDWPSLNSRPLPGWYDEAKFGIFIHWGVFSVPSFGVSSGGASGEWFWADWQLYNEPAYVEYMAANYAPGFSYPEFAPGFTAEFWNPGAWAELFAAAGAKYVVLTSKHHEGFTNWPSATSWNWNAGSTGPHRDLVGNLTAAVKGAGLHMGLYHSLFEWFNPLYLADKAANFTTDAFVAGKTMPELYDLVNTYEPDVVWSDGDWEAPDSYWNSTEFLAWLYNSSPVRDTVVVNDRWGAGDTCVNGGFFTCTDRYNPGSLQNHKWENALTVDQFSWGYRRNANYSDYLTVPALLTQLVSTVACGGNMLLNVGPAHDGTIDAIFVDRLLGMGAWLAVNGDAIYATTPWRAQNDTAASVWYTATTTPAAVYATALAWPANNRLLLTVPITSAGTTVTMLGVAGSLNWTSLGSTGLVITLPSLTPATLPCQYAWSFRLTNVQ